MVPQPAPSVDERLAIVCPLRRDRVEMPVGAKTCAATQKLLERAIGQTTSQPAATAKNQADQNTDSTVPISSWHDVTQRITAAAARSSSARTGRPSDASTHSATETNQRAASSSAGRDSGQGRRCTSRIGHVDHCTQGWQSASIEADGCPPVPGVCWAPAGSRSRRRLEENEPVGGWRNPIRPSLTRRASAWRRPKRQHHSEAE